MGDLTTGICLRIAAAGFNSSKHYLKQHPVPGRKYLSDALRQGLKPSLRMLISTWRGRIISRDFQQEIKDMRRAAIGALVAAMFAAPAFAITVADVDTDGDSLASFTEMTAKYPDLTEETFGDIDTSDDGFVDDSELTAAIDSGLIEEPAE